jgi:hypothetical protein
MASDRYKFITLINERDGSVSFGNDDSTKIIGNGTVRHYYIWVDYSMEYFHASTSFMFFFKQGGIFVISAMKVCCNILKNLILI